MTSSMTPPPLTVPLLGSLESLAAVPSDIVDSQYKLLRGDLEKINAFFVERGYNTLGAASSNPIGGGIST
ncbi:MAG: hypothetical protein AABX70_06420 [Nanoarchaeota archaeon]